MEFDQLNLKEYEIVEQVGELGLVRTYLARQVNLARYVAIRHIHTERHQSGQRFANELASLAMLRHPSNTRVMDAGAAEIAGRYGPYVVHDYTPGDSLADVLEQTEVLETAEVLRLGRQLLGALAEAHRCGVLHRQLSPLSLRITQHHGLPDHVTVLDYGIESSIDRERWILHNIKRSSAADFAAPEVLNGDPPTVRSDIFSAACILYRCAVGLSFSAIADTEPEVRYHHFDQLAGLKIKLIEAIDPALNVDPGLRHPSAEAFLEALTPVFEQAHDVAALPPSMSRFTVRRVLETDPTEEDTVVTLSARPTIWVLADDPALTTAMQKRIAHMATHYEVHVLDKAASKERARALMKGEIDQPWLVIFGDIHVIMQNALLGVVRDLSTTQRLLVSAQLNAQMLEATVNYCGVDRHVVAPVDNDALSELIEERIADCRRQLLRQEALRHIPSDKRPIRRQSLTGQFATETR